jgi:hypothetical protein
MGCAGMAVPLPLIFLYREFENVLLYKHQQFAFIKKNNRFSDCGLNISFLSVFTAPG